MDKGEQMLETNEETKNTALWYKNLSLYGAAAWTACFLFFFQFIYKVWHLAFYYQASIFLAATFFPIQRGTSDASERLHQKPFLKRRPRKLERRVAQSSHQS